jgi:hypothetical protein
MVKIISACLLALFIFGCVLATKTYTPSGQMGYTIECSRSYQTWGDCYQKAGQLCGYSGYDIIMKSEDDKGAYVLYGAYGETTNKRSMLIKCK